MTAPLPGPAATVHFRPDPRTGQPLAVKVYHRPFDQQTRAELTAENGTLGGLRHVRQILLAQADTLPDGRTAVSMPRCPQSLAQRLRATGPLPVDEALAVGEALAVALSAAHRAGIVHGGVHPFNVLFTEPGPDAGAVLSDFGVAARRVAGPPDAAHLGFAAPETLRDGGRDVRSDLYGLGAVLHCALTGDAPHPAVVGEPEAKRILRVLQAPAPPLARDDVPQAAKELIAELLHPQPDRRPATAAAVANRLTVLMAGGSPAPPVRQESAGTPRRPVGRPVAVFGPEPQRPPRRTGPLVAAVLVVAAIGVLVTLLATQDDKPPAAQLPPQAGPSAAPSPLPAPSPSSSTPKPSVRLELPRVSGGVAMLQWRGPKGLTYNVRVAEDGRPGWRDEPTGTRRSLEVPVRPRRGYCFQVQGSDGDDIYLSAPKALRGGTCP